MRLPYTVFICGLLLLSGCPDKKPKHPICASEKDCRDGEHCVNKMCVQCANDEHCADGETCQDGACVKKAGFCSDNSDCADGKICRGNQCVGCDNDADCGPDSKCTDSGRCLARGTCNSNEDCADDEDCVDGTCQKLGRSTTPDVGCKLEPVYFGFDRSAIPEESKSAVNADAQCIQQATGRGVFLVGHTDPRGTEEYNIALSESRANAVADYLSRLGIDPGRFRVTPKGEAEAVGTDEGSWAKDRRVDIEWQ